MIYFVFAVLMCCCGALGVSTPAAGAQVTRDNARFDGPAELPRVYVQSSLADTPAPGKHRQVKAEDDLQEALLNVNCGDTLELQAGAVFTGRFVVPPKSCDDGHWIIIRTNAPDSSLPAEGVRISPCYAGVASLPGRPDFHCTAVKNVLAKLVFDGKGAAGPIQFATGANHYRFLGLEITRAENHRNYMQLVSLERDAVADHIVFDRVWMHGTAQDEIARGIQLGGSRYVAVVDSFFSDFHCIARSGACEDSQAIGGGNSDHPMGPYKIVNNYLEAAGENIIFGGAHSTMTPADIEIRHNYLFKPLIWLEGQPGFVGAADGNPFIVKNHFELKNGTRVLFEGNVLENNWGGFSQRGFSILLTPKNQIPNVCPICEVTDVTIRYNKISHVGAGMVLGNGPSGTGGVPHDGQRYSIHDVVIDDIGGSIPSEQPKLAQVSTGKGCPVLQHVKIDHITAFPPLVLLNVGNDLSNGKMSDFTFTNNLVSAGERQITTTGAGGLTNCAAPRNAHSPKDVFDNCFQYTFKGNVIIGTRRQWPSGNFYPGSAKEVGFVNFNNGQGGDYRLAPTSKFKDAGTDKRDPGADLEAIEKATAGVTRF